MKKSLLLAPVIAVGIFAGVSGEASANEVNHNTKEGLQKVISYSSVYDNARQLKSMEYVYASTSRYDTIHYYKFYYDGSSGYAPFNFQSEGNHKLNILNGNLIRVATENNNTASNLTYGWNYVEVIQTAAGNVPNQPYKFAIGWE
ncbi:hypothetical protein ACQKM9_01555 [Viridibacillus sp. NPDC093762]|uniref:hypothetical protein n=1 Tax=Viridibacillus sp. NPDC093762 TaxID=3390720 RepID=UPI003CFD7F41